MHLLGRVSDAARATRYDKASDAPHALVFGPRTRAMRMPSRTTRVFHDERENVGPEGFEASMRWSIGFPRSATPPNAPATGQTSRC
jgi:hypothetical protein